MNYSLLKRYYKTKKLDKKLTKGSVEIVQIANSIETQVDEIIEIIRIKGIPKVVCATCHKNDELWYSKQSGWCCTRCYK